MASCHLPALCVLVQIRRIHFLFLNLQNTYFPMSTTPLVSIRCLVYNHEPYLRQCLEGFVMQKTNFPFEAIVHDDASTDGSAAIIREYAEKYPDIIKPIYETENQYSKRDGSLRRIMDERMRGKYIAMCEGDDYWIDSQKLQKQVDFMESHLDYSLCFHASYSVYQNDEKPILTICYDKEDFDVNDVILGGGGMMATNSMFFRTSLGLEYPSWRKSAPVGDLPLMLILATSGKVHYIDEIMSVYRLGVGIWSSNTLRSLRKISSHYRKIHDMFCEFDEWTEFIC